MNQSPCLTLLGREGPCEFLHRDKNHPDCVDCDLRVRYAVKRGILHPEVLTKQEDPLVLEARKATPKKKRKHCKDCHRPKPIKARNRCSTCYQRWKYHNPEKVRGYRKRGNVIEYLVSRLRWKRSAPTSDVKTVSTGNLLSFYIGRNIILSQAEPVLSIPLSSVLNAQSYSRVTRPYIKICLDLCLSMW